MDSAYFNSSSSSSSTLRSRVDSSFSTISTKDNNSIKKSSTSRPQRQRSISSTTLERHPSLLPEQVQQQLSITARPSSRENWNPPRTTAASHRLPAPVIKDTTLIPVLEQQQQQQQQQRSQLSNSVTGPREDPTATITKPERVSKIGPPTISSDMASLGYLPPPQYGSMAFHDPAFDSSYQSLGSQPCGSQSSNINSLFNPTSFPNHSLYTSGALSMEPSFSSASLEPSVTHISDTMSNLNRGTSPFHQPVYDGLDYPSRQVASSRSISHSPMSSHQLPVGSMSPPLHGMERSPNYFEPMFSPSFTSTSVQPSQHLYQPSQSFSYPPPQPLNSSTRHSMPRLGSESQVRVLNQKPKPQCWEHGCNGREFSTFSNLLRHQREKSGTAAKSYCPKCGAEFTRTTARNGHLAHEKCTKQRRTSTDEK